MTKTALAVAAQAPAPIIEYRSPLLERERFAMMWQLAEAMARAKTLPTHLHGSAGDCLRIVELADRCGQSPFALADHTFFVQGKLALDGQGMASLVNAHPRIVGSLRYEYSGTGEGLAVRVVGRLRGEEEDRDVSATVKQGLADSKGARQRWQADPEQMLAYYGARKWARRHAPEVTMGLYTPDELHAGADGGTSMRDITPRDEPRSDPTHDPETDEVDESTKPTTTDDRMARFWARPSYFIKLNGGGPSKRAMQLDSAMKAAPDEVALRKLWVDNEGWLEELRDETEAAYNALAEAFDVRLAMLGDEATGPVTDVGPDGRLAV